jgi:catechol 2,3-dioxygenase-like lactoylglutathione lyase family enzyme
MHPDDPSAREAKLDPARGRLAPCKISHVVRRTARYAELLAWYQSVLGLRVVSGDERLTFLSYDDEHHRLAIANMPGLPDQPPLCAGVDHVAFGFADLGDLLQTYARLAREGITPYWCINHGPTTSLYYKDPDGSRVELQAENFESLAACMRWMESEEFAANPLGVIFDPEELLARYRAGEPLEKLAARPPLPEGATPAQMFRF